MSCVLFQSRSKDTLDRCTACASRRTGNSTPRAPRTARCDSGRPLWARPTGSGSASKAYPRKNSTTPSPKWSPTELSVSDLHVQSKFVTKTVQNSNWSNQNFKIIFILKITLNVFFFRDMLFIETKNCSQSCHYFVDNNLILKGLVPDLCNKKSCYFCEEISFAFLYCQPLQLSFRVKYTYILKLRNIPNFIF